VLLVHTEVSRQDTTHLKASHLAQLPLLGSLGSRRWVRDALSIRIAESRADISEVSDILLCRHYLRRRATPPRVLVMSYLGSLGGQGACALVQVAMLPANTKALEQALGVHACSILTLTRAWRADDCTPSCTPGLMPLVIRRVVRRLGADWTERKCQRVQAKPRVLISYCDPEHGHDGGLYIGAGAVALGPCAGGKILFAWSLDESLREPLEQYAQARADRRQELA